MQIDKLKRTALGVLAAIAVIFAFEALPSGLSSELAMKRLAGYFYVWPAIYGLPKVFAAMFVGAYVARCKFVVPAVVLSVIGWSFAIHFLNQIAHAVGQHNLADVAAMNVVGLLIQTGGAVLGAIAGYHFYLSRRANAVSAN